MNYSNGPYGMIGLAGRAGAGKDTAADVLCQAYQFFRLAFADPVRKEIVKSFGIDARLFGVSTKELKTDVLAIGRCDDAVFMKLMGAAGHDIAAPRSPREIMRWWGTEYRRAQNPMYWINKARAVLDEASSRGFRRFVITDLRFKNEADFVRRHNGQVWMVKRAGADAVIADHQSESELVSIEPDVVIENNGSVVSFATAIMKSCEIGREAP